MVRRLSFLLTLLVLSSRPGSAASRFFPTLELPVSVRGTAMGSAPNGLELNAFAARTNPAALGFVRGFNAGAMRGHPAPIVPKVRLDFASAVVGTERRIGRVPVGLSVGVNRTYLDYATVDPYTHVASWEETTGGTMAISVADLVSAGLGVKRLWIHEAETGDPDRGLLREGKTTVFDYGLLMRLPLTGQGETSSRAWEARMTAGLSWLNRGSEVRLPRGNRNLDYPLPAGRWESLGLDLDLLPATTILPAAGKWPWRLFRDAHLVSVSAAVARETPRNSVTMRGLEVRFLNSLSLRWGYVDDMRYDYTMSGNTFGWGVALGDLVGVDYARTPYYPGLKDVSRWGIRLQSPLEVD